MHEQREFRQALHDSPYFFFLLTRKELLPITGEGLNGMFCLQSRTDSSEFQLLGLARGKIGGEVDTAENELLVGLVA